MRYITLCFTYLLSYLPTYLLTCSGVRKVEFLLDVEPKIEIMPRKSHDEVTECVESVMCSTDDTKRF